MNLDNYISLVDYATIHGLDRSALRRAAAQGRLVTAKKIGRDWFVDKDDVPIDRRVTTGQYRDWKRFRKPSKED